MKVILNRSYMNLGEAGSVVNVKPGFARNYLIPQKIALSASASNVRMFADKAKKIEAQRLEDRSHAEKLKGSLVGLSIHIQTKTSDEGKLFGSISAREIQEELKKKGAEVDRRQIILSKPIKMAGDYSASIRLLGNISVNLPIKVESDNPSHRQMKEEAEALEAQMHKENAQWELNRELEAKTAAEAAAKEVSEETPEA